MYSSSTKFIFINDDPEFTLTHFKTMSIFAKFDFALYYTAKHRSRYQVSVYRTIGPLVLIYAQNIVCWFSLEPPNRAEYPKYVLRQK